MSPAWLSLIAFSIALLVSCVSEINVGLLAIALAFIVGVGFADMTVAQVAGGFPSQLFVVLVGVTLFFSQASANGTLEKVARSTVRLARGNVGLIPLIFFLLAATISSVGAGNIAATALLAPVAMSVASRIGVSAFLMTISVCCGANAGALSPFAPGGIIANGVYDRIGIAGQAWPTFLNNFAAETFVGVGGYLLLGGFKLFSRPPAHSESAPEPASEALTWNQKLTIVMIALLVFSVVILRIDVGMAAFAAAAVMTLSRAASEEAAIRRMPWNVILMVCGVTVLISILERNGGMDLITTLLARFSTQGSITAVMAFVTGLVSVYSSSTGVVLPAFLPTIPGLIEKMGGGDPIAIASSINVGAFLVDVSPLSTLGALCIANTAPTEDRRLLFNKLMTWGLSMCVVGALVCWLFFGLL